MSVVATTEMWAITPESEVVHVTARPTRDIDIWGNQLWIANAYWGMTNYSLSLGLGIFETERQAYERLIARFQSSGASIRRHMARIRRKMPK